MSDKLLELQKEKERRERLEHRDALLAIGTILRTKEGMQLFSYLFKNLEVGNIPERGMEGNELHDYLGFLRAGNSIYKLTCEADFEIAGKILSEIERGRYEDKLTEYKLEHELGHI